MSSKRLITEACIFSFRTNHIYSWNQIRESKTQKTCAFVKHQMSRRGEVSEMRLFDLIQDYHM